MNHSQCVRCNAPIADGQKSERYSYREGDARRVHSACVGEMLKELLATMAAVPVDRREAIGMVV